MEKKIRNVYDFFMDIISTILTEMIEDYEKLWELEESSTICPCCGKLHKNGASHPQMREVADKALDILFQNIPAVFEDIYQ